MNNIKEHIKSICKLGAFILAGNILLPSTVKAQLLPLNAQYFQNKYLANPALAGMDQNLNINGSLRKQWSNIPGAPLSQGITADLGVDKVGLGVNIYNEKSGGLQYTKAYATFAYHLPLNNEDQKLNFGVSFGASRDRFDLSSVKNSDPNDPSIIRFNDRGYYFDGDFGIAYTSNGLRIEGALPNLRSVLRKDDQSYADKALFYSAVGYRFAMGSGIDAVSLEPKAVFRGIKNYDNLWDAGVNAGFADDKLTIMAMYHNTKNVTFGAGINYKSSLYIMAYYNSSTAALSGYTGGDFEVNVRFSIGKK